MQEIPETAGPDVPAASFYEVLVRATPRFFVTPALIAANVAYFAIAVPSRGVPDRPRSPASPRLSERLYGPLVFEGEWWRIASANFVHIGFLHLFLNMWCLWSLGNAAERMFGNLTFLIIYLLSGIGGSLASLAWHPSVLSAGASGAIFGIAGALVSMLYFGDIRVPRQGGARSAFEPRVLRGIQSAAGKRPRRDRQRRSHRRARGRTRSRRSAPPAASSRPSALVPVPDRSRGRSPLRLPPPDWRDGEERRRSGPPGRERAASLLRGKEAGGARDAPEGGRARAGVGRSSRTTSARPTSKPDAPTRPSRASSVPSSSTLSSTSRSGTSRWRSPSPGARRRRAKPSASRGRCEPRDISLYVVSSQLLLEAGRLDEAVAVLEEARTWAPESAPVESQMGLVRLRRGENGLALEAFRKAVSLEPDDPENHNRLALGLSRVREGDCGLEAIEKALELLPDAPHLLDSLGTVRLARGETEEAIAAYRRAVELDPGHAVYRFNLSVALARDGKIREAEIESERRRRSWILSSCPGGRRANHLTRRAIVIGGGAIGVASAYYLQRSGFAVTIVDRGDVGRACSYGNSCLIVPSHSEPLPGPGVVGQALRFLLSRTSPFYVRPRLDPALAGFFWRFRKHCNRESAERGFEALVGLSRASLELYQELTSAKEADFYFRREGLARGLPHRARSRHRTPRARDHGERRFSREAPLARRRARLRAGALPFGPGRPLHRE